VKFGRVPIEDAEGAILVHTIKADGTTIRKGAILGSANLARIKAAGFPNLMVARLEDDDAGENDAASAIAAAAAGANVTSSIAANGRCNLASGTHGLALIERNRIDALNALDEGSTVATIEPYGLVQPGDLLATVKIVPFALSKSSVDRGIEAASTPEPVISVAAFAPKRTGLLQTVLPGARMSLVKKMVHATQTRIDLLGGTLRDFGTCGHDEQDVSTALTGMAEAGIEIALVLGASAIADRRDVIPAAVDRAGGRIVRFGMPVDPGHLTLFAALGEMSVLGVPGSARSPRKQGFDWVLQRLFAGLEVDGEDLTQMGVGGLLTEVPGRPMPRRIADRSMTMRKTPKIAALVFAAGQSRRMGPRNKLLEEIDGVAMIRRVVEAATSSGAGPVFVVIGHQADRVRGTLAGLPVEFVENPDFEEGISASLRHGIGALPEDCDGVLICLGDMPRVESAMLDRLINAFDPAAGSDICVPVHQGKQGNPVLWGNRYFREMRDISGDVGAKHLIGRHAEGVREIEMDGDGVLLDVDSPEALGALKARDEQTN